MPKCGGLEGRVRRTATVELEMLNRGRTFPMLRLGLAERKRISINSSARDRDHSETLYFVQLTIEN